jgi:hypothetical protein
MEQMELPIKQKLSNNYECHICQYKTDRKSNLNNHFISLRHQNFLNGTDIKQPLSNTFECMNCHIVYKTSSGLWKHTYKKTCKIEPITQNPIHIIQESNITQGTTNITQGTNNITQENKELISLLIQQQSDMKTMLIEQLSQNTELLEIIKNGTHNTTNSNNTFNLNFFLNETCKDAMNFTEFEESLISELSLKDLERIGTDGYFKGVLHILKTKLNSTPIHLRPLHCTDKKREIIYIKENGVWEKDKDNKRVKRFIPYVGLRSYRFVIEFKIIHPDCTTSNSIWTDQYNQMGRNCCSAVGTNMDAKIITQLVKEIYIDKY